MSVSCVATAATASVIRERGLTVRSERFGSFAVRVDAETELSQRADVLIIAVKEVDLGAALARVPVPLMRGGVVVPFLNGIDHLAVLREHFDGARVVAGTIRVESSRTVAGEIHQVSPFAAIEIATDEPEAMPEPLRELCDVLINADVDVHVCDGEAAILWGKLSFLAPLALLTTAHSARAGTIRTVHRDELIKVVAEVATVARAEGVSVDDGVVLALLDSVPETMQSSMQRDLAAGRPIEVEAIGGAIVRHARAHSIAVPEVSRIVADLRARAVKS